jgi:hypothetical protein
MENKEKQVKIPMSLFIKILYYFLFDETDSHEQIKSELESKLDSMVKHELYTKSKIADTKEEREKARKEYLDMIGMRDSFRW